MVIRAFIDHSPGDFGMTSLKINKLDTATMKPMLTSFNTATQKLSNYPKRDCSHQPSLNPNSFHWPQPKSGHAEDTHVPERLLSIKPVSTPDSSPDSSIISPLLSRRNRKNTVAVPLNGVWWGGGEGLPIMPAQLTSAGWGLMLG